MIPNQFILDSKNNILYETADEKAIEDLYF